MQDELKLPLQQIRTAREYTLSLLEDLQPEEWYQMPSPPISHIAWHGDASMSERQIYRKQSDPLGFFPFRGKGKGCLGFFNTWMKKLFDADKESFKEADDHEEEKTKTIRLI